jgi:hypothetical protein
MSHTQGPWKLLKFADDERYVVTNSAGNKRIFREIATVEFGFSEKAETEQHANAKLIAAAPQMLQALEAVLEKDPDAEVIVRAAIAEATGAQS